MGKKLWLFLACMMMSASMAFAQKSITGSVVDEESGEPLIGASVRIAGTSQGVVTDANGKFTLTLPANARMLQISYMGMRTVNATARNGMKVSLENDAKLMDDVMVVAYGTATKSSFTGSAAVLGTDKIEAIQSTNVMDALTGQVAGVELFNATGDPTNNNPSIRIRGISSISAGTAPLIVLDGTPYEGDMNTINPADIASMTVLKDAAATALYGARAANGVIMLTTKKAKVGEGTKVTLDAKWGCNSRAQRTYKTINNPAQYYEAYYKSLENYAINEKGMSAMEANLWANQNMTGANDYGLGMNIYNVPTGQLMVGTNGKFNPAATLGNLVNYNGQDYLLTSDDWMKEAYRNGLRQEYNLNVSNATDKGSFYASVGYLKNEGITFNSSMETINGRLKADLQAKPWLRIGANMGFQHYDAKSMLEDGTSNSSANIFASATQIAPVYPVFIRDGKGNIMKDKNGLTMYDWADGNNAGTKRPYLPGSNALQQQQLDVSSWEGNAFNINGFAEIRFLKDFKFTSINTVNFDESRATSLTNPYYGSYAEENGILDKQHSRTVRATYLQQLDWNHQFGKHDLGATFAHEYTDNRSYFISGNRSNMFDPNNLELDGAVKDGNSASSYTSRVNREAIVGRLLYDYDQRYFLSASYRREASSRFSSEGGRWWGNFYSAGAAWLINKENFMKKADWVDLLKLKLSYGEVGNDRIGNYLYTDNYSLKSADGRPAVLPSGTRGNKEITWETVGELNAGVEFELFNNRLNGSIDYFWRKTSDMLYFFSTPISTGFSGYYDNVGDMRNSGIEVSLNADIIRNADFKWNVGLNLTHYKNKITYMPEEKKTATLYDLDGNEYKGYQTGNMFVGQGLSLGTYVIPEYAGIYNENTWQMTEDKEFDPTVAGRPMWWFDVTDEDGKRTGEHKATYAYSGDENHSSATEYVISKGLLPKLYGGFNTRLEYKGFDLNIDFAYQLGGKVIDSDYRSFMASPTKSIKGQNMHADLLNAWSADNQSSNIPRLQWGDENNAALSSFFLTDASYLSLKDIKFGYTLPRNLTKKAGIETVRLYVSAQNVWLWSARQGFDPRSAATDLSYGSSNSNYYSMMRTISAGVSVTF